MKTYAIAIGIGLVGITSGMIGGYIIGAGEPEVVVKCDVNDMSLAAGKRSKQIGAEVEKLINTKMRLKSEISGYELKRKSLIGELGLLETQVVDTKVFIEEAREALEKSTKSAFKTRGQK